MRHRLERRVEAHLVLCVLAYLVEKHLELTRRDAGVTAERGEPWTGHRAITRFLDLTADEQVVGEGGPTRWVFRDLDPAQSKILRVAGVDPERFQRGWPRLR